MPQRAKVSASFFKDRYGEYGEGDQFLGVTVPEQRTIAKQFADLSLPSIAKLLILHGTSAVHRTGSSSLHSRTSWETVMIHCSNAIWLTSTSRTWRCQQLDLVDTSAPKLLGAISL